MINKSQNATFAVWMIPVTAVVAAIGCFQARSAPAGSSCSREAVLNRLGKAIERDDPASIRNDLLSASDLMTLKMDRTSPSAKQPAAAFDAESLNDAKLMMNAIRRRMRHPHFERAQLGQIRGWRVEGTTLRLDADEQSSLIFDDDGHITRMPVERVVRIGSCWKIETVGYGVTNRSQSDTYEVPPPPGVKRITPAELCTGLIVYTTPQKSEPLGELIEQYDRYRDSRTGRVFSAVLLKTHVNGEIKGRWEKLEKIFDRYCRTDDPALTNCRWSVRKEEVTADPSDEIPPE